MADTSVIFNILAKDNASGVFGKVGKAMSSVLMGTGMAVGSAAMSGLGRAFGFAKDAVFGFNSTLQNSQIAFTTMLGSGAKAQAFLGDLQAFAKKTPFEFEGLVKNAQNMMGMGIAARDVIPDLTALGDSVASIGGSAEQVDQVTLAFDQMAAKGTLDMGNMNQLLQGGVPNALRILADSYNVTTGQMIQMISTGKVQSSEALPKLIAGLEHGTKSVQGLGGMMDKQSQTFTGALSNIKDGLQQALAGAFRPFFDVASSGAQKLGSFFSGDTFSAFGKRVSAGISAAFAAVKGFNFSPLIRAFTAVRTVVMTDLVPAGRSLFATFGPMLKSAFNTAYSAIGPVLSILGTVGSMLKSVFGFVSAHKTTFQALAVGILAVVAAQKAWALAIGIWSTVTRIATAVQAAFNIVMAMNPIGLIIIAVIALVAAFAYLWTHSAAFRNFFIGMWNGIKAAVFAVGAWFAGPFVNFFVAAGHAIAAPFLWLWHNVLDPAWQAWSTGARFVMNIVSSLAHLWLFAFQNTVGRVVLWLWHEVYDPAIHAIAAVTRWLWDNAVRPVFAAVATSARAVGTAAMWLWHNAIEPAMHGAGATVRWLYNNVVAPVFGAIRGAVNTTGNVIHSVFSKVGGWIGAAFSGAAGIVKGAMNGVIGVINGAIRGINMVISLANAVPGVNFPRLPQIPRLAAGGTLATGGLVEVGERGKEIVSLPAGATVHPNGTGPGGAMEMRITGGGALWTVFKQAVRAGDITFYDSSGQRVTVT